MIDNSAMDDRSILVVEDEEGVRIVVRAALEQVGYRVTTAANGVEATRLLEDEHFGLVLTDVLMPDKDGIEIISDLRREYPELPVIAMSGGGRLPRDGYLAIARHLGAHAILEKPFTVDELLATVDRLLAPASA
jgi:DNA-binding NtrC family response regulator